MEGVDTHKYWDSEAEPLQRLVT